MYMYVCMYVCCTTSSYVMKNDLMSAYVNKFWLQHMIEFDT